MKYYFQLQYSRMHRKLKELGIMPIVALLVAMIIFIFLSKLLFLKLVYANWIYSLVGVSFVFKLSNRNHNNLLKKIFSNRDYVLLRIIENSIIILPFQLYLLWEGEYLTILILLVASIIFSRIHSDKLFNRAIPTPFKRYPFEFIVGFRKTFIIIALAYFLIIKAIEVDNYNLAIFALVLIFLTSISYFTKPENEYFVWIYTDCAKGFLRKKFYITVISLSILSGLALLIIVVGFSSYWLATLAAQLFGYILVGSMIVAKYSAFPHEMNVPQGILYALSLLFPPMLLITIAIFYVKSEKNLKPVLEC